MKFTVEVTAMNALADVKMLNLMSKTSIKAAQKQIDPPLNGSR